jgi:hypothetical protein
VCAQPLEFIAPDLSIPRAIQRDEVPFQPIEADVRHTYPRVADRLELAIEAVSGRVTVNPSSRVARWSKAIRRLADADKRAVLEQIIAQLKAGEWDHPFRESFLALNESRMFVEIVEQLVDYLPDHSPRELVSGHPDPAMDSASARGRDKEFEWFVAAVLRRCGLAVAIAEPDVLIRFGDGVRSVAAKRLTSRKQINSNAKRASDQILKVGYPGYIFLEVTRYLDPEFQFMEHWRHQGEPVRRRLNAIARKPELIRRRNDCVEGVFIRAAFPLISPGFVYGTSEHWAGVAVNGGDKQEHMRLTRILMAGVRGI